MRVRVGVCLLGSAGMIFGQQQQFWQPEVRRAIPVEKPTPTPEQVPRGYSCGKARANPAVRATEGPVSEPGMDAARATFAVSSFHSRA